MKFVIKKYCYARSFLPQEQCQIPLPVNKCVQYFNNLNNYKVLLAIISLICKFNLVKELYTILRCVL